MPRSSDFKVTGAKKHVRVSCSAHKFECLDLQRSFRVCRYMFAISGSSSYYQGHRVKVKVTGAKKRVYVCYSRVICVRLKGNIEKHAVRSLHWKWEFRTGFPFYHGNLVEIEMELKTQSRRPLAAVCILYK